MATIVWTEEDYTRVKDAYLEAVTGNRKVQFSIGTGGGFSRSATFQPMSAAQLAALMNQIRAYLDGTTSTQRVVLRTSKGI
jgi:hypothetical protein